MSFTANSEEIIQRVFNKMKKDRLSFSQAQGYVPIPDSLKLEELPISVRQEFELCIVKAFQLYHSYSRNKKVANWWKILRELQVQFFNQAPLTYPHIDENYLQNWIRYKEFNLVFDLIEELVNRTAHDQPSFYADVKSVFERRKLAYRLIGSLATGFSIIPTTNELEVLEVNNTFKLLSLQSPQFDAVIKHFMRAGKFLTEGEYGKSISESSSAVEATLRILVNEDKEYNTVFKKFLKSIKLHPLFEKQIKQLIDFPFLFASDISDGRHASKQEGYEADQFDAQIIFTDCCGIVQYLINKQVLDTTNKERQELVENLDGRIRTSDP